jgi:hypothetical protein
MAVIINGNNTPTAGSVTYGDGTQYANTASGSAGQVLTSAGSSAPVWATPASVNLATGVTGTLPIANGGTNSTATPTAGGVVYGTGTAQAVTTAGSSGQLLQSNGASAPSWVAAPTGGYTLGTPVATTSGSTVQYLSIPAGTKQIIFSFSLVSTNGTATKRIQLGTTSGFASTGYSCGVFSVIGPGTPTIVTDSLASAFLIPSIIADEQISGQVVFTLLDAATYKWSGMGILSNITDGSKTFITSGAVTLPAVLDRIRLTTFDTFDNGSVNIAYI